MSPTRIRRIKKVRDYRIFQDWKTGGDVEFSRVNLIYGHNGSGKSTLTSLLQGCAAYAQDQSADRDEHHAEVAAAGVELSVELPESSTAAVQPSLDVDLQDTDFWRRVRVFNREFVLRSLHFDADGGPQPEALLTIGEKLVDAEEQLKELRPRRESLRRDVQDAKKACVAADKAVETKLSQVARQVVDDLHGSSIPRYRATNVYNKRHVRELLEADPSPLDDDDASDVVSDRKRATSEAMAAVPMPPRDELLGVDGLEEARRVLVTDVLTHQVIEDLVGHPRRSAWVQEGITLHEGLNECLFCGSDLSNERRQSLSAHFDESFRRLQSTTDHLIARLTQSVKISEAFAEAFPSESSLYEEARDGLRAARHAYAAAHKTYAMAIETVITALREKKDNPFCAPELPSSLTLEPPSLTALTEVLARHQSRIDAHGTETEAAARRVEYYHVRQAADEYAGLKEDASAQKAALEKLEKEELDLSQKIAALENVEGDPLPGARALTAELCALLGRDELTIATLDAKHYAITRGDEPATNLSEGEQTAIALLYFLASIREDKIQGEPPIVVIDDPVSSLDQGILFGASAHLWSELVGTQYASQIFLLTHNFDLFRHWLIQLSSRQQYEGCDYRAYEMTAVAAPRGRDVVVRRPQIRRWETDQDRSKVLRSEYHYLFSRVAHALVDRGTDESLADQMNEMALMPNAARRMLEAFLSFKCPGKIGSFHVAVEEVMDEGVPLSVRTRVERYLHTYSHFDAGDISQPLQLTEVTAVLRSLFQLMNHVDPDHVSAMCCALAIDKERLVGTDAPSPVG